MFALRAFAAFAAAATVVAQDAQLPLTKTPGVLDVRAMSAAQRETLMLDIWASMDVVDLMRITGNDYGLDEQRLVHIFDEDEPRFMTEGDKLRLKRAGRSFMDITEHTDLGALNAQRPSQLHSSRALSPMLPPSDKERLRAAMEVLDEQNLRDDIATLSSFWNRNYRSEWGRKSSHWIFKHVQGILNVTNADSKLRTSVRKFPHKFPQSSIIARIEAVDDDAEDKHLIIVGAHQDSLNYRMPFYRAPGADDDGSGSVTIMQVLRSVLEHEFVPPKGLAVEFHWYAAEEVGLQPLLSTNHTLTCIFREVCSARKTSQPSTSKMVPGSRGTSFTMYVRSLCSCGPACYRWI